jgi:N-acetylglucosaminyldiphosphoundecaprenol N-acetyl-beta-D-mannosaminyltransferase
MNGIKLLGYDIFSGDLDALISEVLHTKTSLVINTINPHSYVVQKSDEYFKQALNESDYLIPDGSGFVLASKCIQGKKLTKISGYDLFSVTMQKLEKCHGKVFFLGSTEIVLEKIIKRAEFDYPNVKVETLSPPYKHEFDENDLDLFASEINEVKPDVVFVGLTAPKQEKLILSLKGKCQPKFFSGIGAVFDFYAGTVKRPNQIWLDFHLEWFFRFLGEPKRLWKRNFVSTPIFLKDTFIEALRCRFTK